MIETSPNQKKSQDPLPILLIRLFKGVLYRVDAEREWQTLLSKQAAVVEYMAKIGLDLLVDEAEGYAFLKSKPDPEDDADKLPRLVTRRPLTFPVSLILALLRKRLTEFDASGSDSRLILSRNEIVETVRLFLPTSNNEARVFDQIDVHLNKIEDMGFIRLLKPSRNGNDDAGAKRYEVAAQKERLNSAQLKAEKDEADCDSELDKLRVQRNTKSDAYAIFNSEITSLKTRTDNIPTALIQLRERLCDELHMKGNELPFVGELVQVRKEERLTWEGSIERYLHGFSLSMLVPRDYYPDVAKWVDKTHLGGRLTYYQVKEPNRKEHTPLSDNALRHKIEIQPESAFYEWLDDRLNKIGNIVDSGGIQDSSSG